MTRLATVGCGEHATGSHGPSFALYAARHPGTDLVACCDLDPGKAERYRARFGFARAYTDLRRMLDTERPDAVSLVAPVERTCELACLIFEWGFPLLLEKPPGRTVAEVDRMITAAGGVAHQVAFNRRFAPLVRELKREVDAHVAPAELLHLHYEMTRVGRRDPDFSTTAIHGIDAVRYLAGSDYAEIRFRYQALPGAGPGVANIFLDAVMASGASAHLAFCPVAGVVVERAAVHGRDHTFYAQVPMWDGFDAPGGGKKVNSMVAGINMAVFKFTKNKDAALQFVKFMTSDAEQVARLGSRDPGSLHEDGRLDLPIGGGQERGGVVS